MSGELVDHKVQEKVFDRLPAYFWAGFAGELVAVFGLDIFDEDNEGDWSPVYFMTGTSFWNQALKMACYKVGEEWLYTYYTELPWYESQIFNEGLVKLLIANFIGKRRSDNRDYCKYLAGRV